MIYVTKEGLRIVVNETDETTKVEYLDGTSETVVTKTRLETEAGQECVPLRKHGIHEILVVSCGVKITRWQ